MGKPVKNRIFGLIGKHISYSFSQQYFGEKFSNEGIENTVYQNFDLPHITDITEVFAVKNLKGLNVTIPYKEAVIPYLDKLDPIAATIGAVNTIQIIEGKRVGYNTDVIGFRDSLKSWIKAHHKKALILGTGGASKGVHYVLNEMGIPSSVVSRRPKDAEISYDDIKESTLKEFNIIVNCTPLGTFPNVDHCPDLPYQFIDKNHLLYDLIYNPAESTFLRLGKERGAAVKNGQEMLELQAEASWSIWNS